MNENESRATPPQASAETEKQLQFDLEPIDGRDFAFRYDVYSQTIKPYIDALYTWNDFQHAENIRSDLDMSDTHAAIVVQGSRAGIVQIVETPLELSLHQIEILPSFQGRGIGTAIVQSLIRRATEEQKPLRLRVFQANTGARRLYERMGFEVVSETADDVQMEFIPPER